MPTYNETAQGGIRLLGGCFATSGDELPTVATKIVEHNFTGSTVTYAQYDSTKTVLGTLMWQNTGSSGTDKWAGPIPLNYSLIRESAASGTGSGDLAPYFPYVILYSYTLHWIFMVDLSTAAATRKIAAWTYDLTTCLFEFKGIITLTFPSANAHTARAFRVTRHLYTTGTVSVSGTAVTGTDTAWQTARYAVGARIGFGSTDPTDITDWYEITAITNDTSITLKRSAGTIAGGTSFVIDELRIPIVTTNSVTTDGGMFLVKGLCFDLFTGVGVVIPAATTTDNIRATYWLKDASTTTILVASGIAVDDASDAEQICYVADNESATTLVIHKFDLRKSLTGLSAGATTAAFLYKTGISATMPTLGTYGTLRMGTLYHGSGSGEKSIYMYNSVRVYRIPPSVIRDGELIIAPDSMADISPGTLYSTSAQAFANLEISQSLDCLLSSSSAAGLRGYFTKYNAESYPIDLAWGAWTGQIDGSTRWQNHTQPHFNTAFGATYVYMEGGIAYLARSIAGSGVQYQNTMYAAPFGADWNYASSTNARIITPALDTTHAQKFTRLCVNCARLLGAFDLGTVPEPYRVYARTYGIDDNTGVWTQIVAGDLTGIIPSDRIQLMFEFRTIGLTCVPARIYSISVMYETPTTDPHFEPSLRFSYMNAARFVWWFKTAFGCDVPQLRVRIYDADTNVLLSDDYSDLSTGLFEKSTDSGATWATWNNLDKANETTYIRYTYRSGTSTIVRSRIKAILSLA